MSTETTESSLQCTAEISLKRTESDEDKWGLQLETVPGTEFLIVRAVLAGAAETYNRYSPPGKYKFQPFDIIMKANGMTDSGSMKTLFEDDTRILALTMVRPRLIVENILKDGGQPLGLTLKHSFLSSVLYVREVADIGAVKSCDANIKEGDLIIAVDGRNGTCKEMMVAIRNGNSFEVTILRIY